MDPADFDRWRASYATASYAEHQAFYRNVAEAYPDQRYYNLPAVRRFLAEAGPRRIFELGGWKGELAEEILSEALRDPPIQEWRNVEIAPQAATQRVCFDPRYSVVVPDRWVWELGWDLSRFDAFIASHVLEHMPKADVIKVLNLVRDCEWLYIDAPLPPSASMWDGGLSSHIIEIGWVQLHDLISSFGYGAFGEAPGVDGKIVWYRKVA